MTPHFAFALFAGIVTADEPIFYPDRSRLLVVRDQHGAERPVRNADDWTVRRRHVLANIQRVMGPLPGPDRRAPLAVKIVSEERRDKYLRRKLTYVSEPSDRVPAWLLLPHLPGRKPAMLCLHQTTTIGKDEPAGLGGQPSLHYAHELAERGFVCLVPDYPSFGEYRYDFRKEGRHYASGSMKAVWNNLRAVDLLEALPEVDADRIGVIGHSLGGHNALFTAVFEPRLKAIVSSCGFTPFHDYYGGKLAGWTSDRYMPRIRGEFGNDPDRVPFDFYEIVAALAPRPFFANAPVRDDNFDVKGVRKAFAEAGKVYDLFGARDRLRRAAPESGHDFPEAVRREAYDWLDKQLAR